MINRCSSRDLDECNCVCHNPSAEAMIVHYPYPSKPCCRQCPYCQKNITFSAFDKHKEQCKKNHILDTEIKYFDQNRQEWFKHHAGKIALVHGTTICGFYDNYANALKAGLDQLGLVPFLLKEVLLEDRVEWL